MHASEDAARLHGAGDRVRRALEKVAAAETALAQARQELNTVQRNAYGWTDGLVGRRLVADALLALAPYGWTFVDAVHWPGRPGVVIDHVGVGPGGVVVMFSRQWIGAVEVRGGVLRQNGIPRLRETAAVSAAAGAISALLDPEYRTTVSAFVCAVQHDVAPTTISPGVNVVGVRDVGEAVAALSPRLAPMQVAHVLDRLQAALVGPDAPEQLTTRALTVYGDGPAVPWPGGRAATLFDAPTSDAGLPGSGLPESDLPGSGLPGSGLPGSGLPGSGLPGLPGPGRPVGTGRGGEPGAGGAPGDADLESTADLPLEALGLDAVLDTGFDGRFDVEFGTRYVDRSIDPFGDRRGGSRTDDGFDDGLGAFEAGLEARADATVQRGLGTGFDPGFDSGFDAGFHPGVHPAYGPGYDVVRPVVDDIDFDQAHWGGASRGRHRAPSMLWSRTAHAAERGRELLAVPLAVLVAAGCVAVAALAWLGVTLV